MKKILRACTLISGLVALALGFLSLAGTIETQWNWTSLSMVVLVIFLFLSSEQFYTKAEPGKRNIARVLEIVLLLTAALLNLLVFIKSVLR